jgi:hypothetical protein
LTQWEWYLGWANPAGDTLGSMAVHILFCLERKDKNSKISQLCAIFQGPESLLILCIFAWGLALRWGGSLAQ